MLVKDHPRDNSTFCIPQLHVVVTLGPMMQFQMFMHVRVSKILDEDYHLIIYLILKDEALVKQSQQHWVC